MKINFENEIFNDKKIGCNAIFVCAIGYEERSYFLYNHFKHIIKNNNIFLFAFEEYISKTDKKMRIKEEDTDGVNLSRVLYSDYAVFFDKIIEIIKQKRDLGEDIELHIDYSYMPRRWYCELPMLIHNSLKKNDKVYFWYAEGEYPSNYQQYPCGGIKSYHAFSGKVSLRPNIKRTHIIALSYDKIRTEGLLTILDPEAFIACDAYDSSTREIHNNVISLNESILSRAEMSVSLHMDDFHFMLSKLSELVNELLPTNDVILVPDGPKPLIFAFSLIPYIVSMPGVTCLHVLRNSFQTNSFDVIANKKVIGFSIKSNN